MAVQGQLELDGEKQVTHSYLVRASSRVKPADRQSKDLEDSWSLVNGSWGQQALECRSRRMGPESEKRNETEQGILGTFIPQKGQTQGHPLR